LGRETAMETKDALDKIALENAVRMAATILLAIHTDCSPVYVSFDRDQTLDEVHLARICSPGDKSMTAGSSFRLPPHFFAGAIALAKLRGGPIVDTEKGVDYCYLHFASDPTERFGRNLDIACVRAKKRAIRSALKLTLEHWPRILELAEKMKPLLHSSCLPPLTTTTTL
jgi:hypothetical protein